MIETNILKFKIVNILGTHCNVDLSIADFERLTNVLDLDSMTLRVRDGIIKTKKEELRVIESNEEWDLLEMLEEDR